MLGIGSPVHKRLLHPPCQQKRQRQIPQHYHPHLAQCRLDLPPVTAGTAGDPNGNVPEVLSDIPPCCLYSLLTACSCRHTQVECHDITQYVLKKYDIIENNDIIHDITKKVDDIEFRVCDMISYMISYMISKNMKKNV